MASPPSALVECRAPLLAFCGGHDLAAIARCRTVDEGGFPGPVDAWLRVLGWGYFEPDLVHRRHPEPWFAGAEALAKEGQWEVVAVAADGRFRLLRTGGMIVVAADPDAYTGGDPRSPLLPAGARNLKDYAGLIRPYAESVHRVADGGVLFADHDALQRALDAVHASQDSRLRLALRMNLARFPLGFRWPQEPAAVAECGGVAPRLYLRPEAHARAVKELADRAGCGEVDGDNSALAGVAAQLHPPPRMGDGVDGLHPRS